VVTDGLYEVLPPGSLLLQTRGRHPVQVRYLDPVEPPYGEGLQRRVVRDLSQRVRGTMVEELQRLRRERRAGEQ
jgi:hypothetical protein